jgi:hypothetical protein
VANDRCVYRHTYGAGALLEDEPAELGEVLEAEGAGVDDPEPELELEPEPEGVVDALSVAPGVAGVVIEGVDVRVTP